MSNYISVTETAKLIRKALKEAFPGVKFSVRSSSYSGGASIRVTWTDGPNSRQVETVAGAFRGAYFDGMIDYKGSCYHRLDGEPVHFGADFVFCDRSHSQAAVTSAIIRAAMEYGTRNLPTVEEFENGHCHGRGPMSDDYEPFWNWSRIIRDELEERDRYGNQVGEPKVTRQRSKTLARVEFAGSDNYQCSQTAVALDTVRGPAENLER